jgi:hypothetical protein
MESHRFLDANRPLWNIVNALFREHFPELVPLYEKVEFPANHPLGLFALAVVNLDMIAGKHHDRHDPSFGVTACIRFGDSDESGGDFGLSEHRILAKTAPGDLLFFNSRRDEHYVTPMPGVRNSLLLFTHEAVFKYYGVQ